MSSQEATLWKWEGFVSSAVEWKKHEQQITCNGRRKSHTYDGRQKKAVKIEINQHDMGIKK